MRTDTAPLCRCLLPVLVLALAPPLLDTEPPAVGCDRGGLATLLPPATRSAARPPS